MPFFFALLALYLIAALVVLPIWTIIKLRALNRSQSDLDRQLSILDREVRKLGGQKRSEEFAFKPKTPPPTPVIESAPAAPPPSVFVPPAREQLERRSPAIPPPLPEPEKTFGDIPASTEKPRKTSLPADAPPISFSAPPSSDRQASPPQRSAPDWTKSINWEQFMGARLFAWLGGLALFLAVAFFVKYSFEHDLIPPEARVAIGFLAGAGLVVGGLLIPRKNYAITAQTLIAAGIVSLYAVTFACRSIYHFEFFGPVPTFLLMSLITATAFILAVRLEAQVVAILGILGGFITPALLSTGVDNPAGLFGYIAVLDIGLIAVVIHRRWFYLAQLGATGTAIMMVSWAEKFYAPGKTLTAMAVCLGFCGLFAVATEAGRRLNRTSPLLGQAAIGLSAIAFCFAWSFLGYPGVAARTWMLFGYVILVSAGVFFLAWREKLGGLVACASAISAVLIIRWNVHTFNPRQAPVVIAVCLVFCAIYFVVYLLARRWRQATSPVLWAAVGMPGLAMGFALFLMNHLAAGANPGLLFLFILASDILLLAVAWLDERLPRLHLVAGLTVFGLLSVWTSEHLTGALLPWALGMFLAFAALHTVFPLLLERRRLTSRPTWWSQLFPPLTLLLMLMPIFRLETVSFLLWPAILLVDLIAVGLALISTSLLAVAAVLVLTLAATGLSLFRIPVTAGLDLSLLAIIGAFAVFFFAVSLWLMRKLSAKLPAADRQMSAIFGGQHAHLPAFAALLPFLLLIMACSRLPVPNASAVFGLGLLLVALTLGLTRILLMSDGILPASDSRAMVGRPAGVEWLPACALAGMAALELVWHARHFRSAAAGEPLAWYLGFYAVFAIYPFLFRRDFSRLTGPWAVAAMSGLAHFWMVYQAIKIGWLSTGHFLGIVPALFALAPLGSLVVILSTVGEDNPKRINQLAWFGGVALFFITLIFPIQLERQWLTVAWALEGTALLWLFHRVPHSALRATGVVLLAIAFVRLALNPAVLGYHGRGSAGIFNWYLYAYGLATAALFTGAWLLAPPREKALGINAPPVLNTLGAVLAFLLLNLEIADYFTVPGAYSLTFNFSGNFARDMSYTIGWALFALGLLGVGIWHRTKAARYAAIVLLSIALLKLFFHDLASLEALYRIGALFAVAVIAMLASFAYQRFLPSHDQSDS
ncbi:MAG: DUF2339 domain-containing protein [Verrucomicrobiae bacterium]